MNKALIPITWFLFLCSCTISFQNVSTHGTATDLIDEAQTNTPDVSPNIALPITPAI